MVILMKVAIFVALAAVPVILRALGLGWINQIIICILGVCVFIHIARKCMNSAFDWMLGFYAETPVFRRKRMRRYVAIITFSVVAQVLGVSCAILSINIAYGNVDLPWYTPIAYLIIMIWIVYRGELIFIRLLDRWLPHERLYARTRLYWNTEPYRT